MSHTAKPNPVVPIASSLSKLFMLLIWIALASQIQAAPNDTSRIVSVGGDVTEILFELGLGDKIVAVDTTSQYPAAVSEKESLGYMRALSTEGVLAVKPSVIIASKHAGPPDVVKALKASSVPFVTVDGDETAEGIAVKIKSVADAAGVNEEGLKLAGRVSALFETLAQDRAKFATRPRTLFVLTARNGKATVGGKGTGADAILRLAGAENVAAEINGYKPLSSEAALSLAPDVILTMEGRHGASADIMTVTGLAASPAAKNNKIISMNGSYLLQFGPRAPEAARDLMLKLHPQLAN